MRTAATGRAVSSPITTTLVARCSTIGTARRMARESPEPPAVLARAAPARVRDRAPRNDPGPSWTDSDERRSPLVRLPCPPMQTILVVDDEPKITQLVRDYLERAGFAVRSARDGPEALMRARTDRPDLVVLDLGLPGLDGFDVTRRLLRDAIHGVAFDSYERAIDAHVKNIRRKIEPNPRTPRYLLTVYGVGYKLADA